MNRVLFFVSLLILIPSFAFADAPASFSISPTTVSYAFGTQVSWNNPAGGTPDFYFSCPPGVTIQNNGATVLCNTTTTLSPNAADIAGLSITNVTGVAQFVAVRMTPKDAQGAVFSDSAQTITIISSPVPQPILDFQSSSSTPASGTPVTFTWHGLAIPGVNLQFDCAADIKVLTDGANPLSALPCGQPAFTTDLAQSGSQALTVINSSLFQEPLSVHVIPSIVSGVYDATHALSVTLFVGGKPVAAGASVSGFSVSSASPASAAPVTFSWAVANADAANLQFSCASGISIAHIFGTSTSSLPCGNPAFSGDVPLTGSTTVSFLNTEPYPVSFSVLLLPKTGSVYDATRGRSLALVVQVPGSIVSSTPLTPLVVPISTQSTGQIKAVRTLTFTLAAQKGSRGSQVSALQQFLAQDSSLYPEGSVTGYFGAATDAALKLFQVRYGIAKPGDAGYGSVGPKTRAKLNSLTYF